MIEQEIGHVLCCILDPLASHKLVLEAILGAQAYYVQCNLYMRSGYSGLTSQLYCEVQAVDGKRERSLRPFPVAWYNPYLDSAFT